MFLPRLTLRVLDATVGRWLDTPAETRHRAAKALRLDIKKLNVQDLPHADTDALPAARRGPG